ncbi:MAG: aspartate--ammonia ligase [Breznakibacter sp.]|nr:aspartate--ammonia ligase [Breznakibacter sp.]
MTQQEALKTEESITLIKDHFSAKLCKELNLVKVSSPLAVLDGTGINDDLNGIERPVSFPIKALQERIGVVVHSLAKWKRLRLKELGIEVEKGILTDMRALRPDEDYTPLHSIYVDQWDWEKHMNESNRTLDYLKNTVKGIYRALVETEKEVEANYPAIKAILPNEITFIHSEELLKMYPTLSPKERENAIVEKHGAIFLMGIGGKLSDGTIHDGRAADYDDWSSKNSDGFSGLNGDILLWHPTLKCSFEVSSMGIRVNKEALERQLKEKDCEDRSTLLFHNMLLTGQLPQSIGGGIGQSRVCMFMLKKTHIGEVQVSIWGEEVKEQLAKEGINLL